MEGAFSLEEPKEPSSPTEAELSPQEMDSLMDAFQKLGAKPKVKTPSDFLSWMTDLVAHQHGPKTEVKFEGDGHEPFTAIKQEHSPKQVLSHQLRLPTFSGEGKGDVTFDLWKYEVVCLRKGHHPSEIVTQAIRRSLRGEAGRIAMRLGPDASIDDLLQKMESVYGEVEQKEMLLAKFYSARQQEKEDVSNWGCRLEDLISKALEKGTVSQTETSNMLRVMFWSGLRDELKDITGHLYERIHDFDQLRVAIRRVEQDHKQRKEEQSSTSTKKPTPCKQAVAETDQLGEIKGLIQQLSTEVKTLRSDQQQLRQEFNTPRRQQPQNSYQRLASNNNNNSGTFHQRNDNPQQQHQQDNRQQDRQSSSRQPEQPSARDDEDIICWRCGQVGHISLGCRVRLDHRRKPLNFNRPMSRGGH